MTNDDLNDLSDSLKKLRVEYEKYFMGVERMEPIKQRDLVKKTLRRFQGEQVNNTGLRFRLQSLQATLVTYEQYWNRITKQIEDGTFKRDKIRAQHMLEEAEAKDKQAAAGEAPQDAATTSTATATAAARPKAPATAQEYPESIRKLHEVYEQTRKQLGGDAAAKSIPINVLASTVQKQIATLKAQYNCKTVEFKVIVKDGKPVLKAIPK